ncbi:MAG TPA: hypothetical protein PKC30_16410 [Saprospiraceae bacterium]|nr:hypothetical protein [Saprospiraceae bacterium]
MNTHTNVTMTDRGEKKQIKVPITAEIKDLLLKHRGKTGLAAGIVTTAGFLTAREIIVDNPLTDDIAVEGENPEVETNIEIENEPHLIIDCEDFIESVSPDLTFSEAFQQSRENMGSGGIFEYKGKYYNTFLREEWDAMSDTDKVDYYNSVSNQIPNNPVKIIEIDNESSVDVYEYTYENILKVKAKVENEEVIEVEKEEIVRETIKINGKVEIEKEVIEPDPDFEPGNEILIVDSQDPEILYVSSSDITQELEVIENQTPDDIEDDHQIQEVDLSDLLDDQKYGDIDDSHLPDLNDSVDIL